MWVDLIATSSPWLAAAAGWLVAGLMFMLWTNRGSRRSTPQPSRTPQEASSVPLPTATQTAALIRGRRSVYPKDMNGKKVTPEEVQQLLEAANWAPTHGKTEPWRFVIIADREKQQEAFELVLQISEANLEAGSKELDRRRAKTEMWTGSHLPKLSHMIVLGCRLAPNASGKRMPEWEEQAAVAASVQNLHLMATSLGLAGYWSSWPAADVRSSQEYQAWLGWVPEDKDTRMVTMGCFFLGRSDRVEAYRAKREPIAEKVSWL